MKRKDKIETYNLSVDELTKQIGELDKKLAELEINRYTKPSKNIRDRKNIRQKIAVLATFIRQKEIVHG